TYHYQEKQRHIEQLATVLTASASTVDGAAVVAEQVKTLLKKDPSIQSIIFYSTPQPISDDNQSRFSWENALFADTVSSNHPVVSNDIEVDSVNIDEIDDQNPQTSPFSETDEITEDSILIGYINITLDVSKLRADWLQSNLLLFFITILLTILWSLYILRKLNWPIKDIEGLTEACDVVINNSELEKLPVIDQRFNFQELVQIKQALIVLFTRLQKVREDYDEVAVFEKQLYSKDRSLNVQLHNFQNMITHELKTSLNAIVGGLQLLDHNALNREQKDAVEIIDDGSKQLVVSLNRIIQLNQIQKGQISVHSSEFNPLHLISELLVEFEPVAREKGIELNSRIHHIDYNLKGDVEKIRQIISALLGNAIKFTSVGQVTITSQLTHFDKSNRWQIIVKDTGIGIDSNHLDDIFNPFFQIDPSRSRQYEGSGVGMSVVKQMAQLMGATIDVDSLLGVGTQFTLTMSMPNQRQERQRNLFAGLSIVYYYCHDYGYLVNELEYLGATVSCRQYEQLMIDDMRNEKADMVMFAEDIPPVTAVSLAVRIRQLEQSDVDHRSLLIYWYPQHRVRSLESFEPTLKAAGIDYCHTSIYDDDNALSELLERWLG
ncbi:MAG: HAMP domain-containing histidine kinase, partial [Psychrobacter sp.]|nr:HAMP domain-containing histidine kinase [Psychrobacter sp.]